MSMVSWDRIIGGKTNMLFQRDITPCFRCYYCREVVTLGNMYCPYCEVEIDQVRARREAATYTAVTRAIQSAHNITNRDLTILLFIAYTFWMRWSGREVLYDVPRAWFWAEIIFAVGWLIPIGAITRWFYLHGN